MSENASKFLNKNLIQRIASAIILAPMVLGAVWVGGPAFDLLIMVAMLIGLSEWLKLTGASLPSWIVVWAYGALLVVFWMAFFSGFAQAVWATFGLAFLLSFMASVPDAPAEGWLKRAVWVGAGLPYLGLSGLALIYLRTQPPMGLGLITYLLMVVWGTDVGAYFAGCLIGGPKLCPKISPKKTWAGLVGGMVLAVVLGYAVALGFGDARPWLPALLAMPLAIVSQVGDFFESYVKRRAGAKDSGNLIPGHGGILDRVDGLLFAAVALAVMYGLRG